MNTLIFLSATDIKQRVFINIPYILIKDTELNKIVNVNIKLTDNTKSFILNDKNIQYQLTPNEFYEMVKLYDIYNSLVKWDTVKNLGSLLISNIDIAKKYSKKFKWYYFKASELNDKLINIFNKKKEMFPYGIISDDCEIIGKYEYVFPLQTYYMYKIQTGSNEIIFTLPNERKNKTHHQSNINRHNIHEEFANFCCNKQEISTEMNSDKNNDSSYFNDILSCIENNVVQEQDEIVIRDNNVVKQYIIPSINDINADINNLINSDLNKENVGIESKTHESIITSYLEEITQRLNDIKKDTKSNFQFNYVDNTNYNINTYAKNNDTKHINNIDISIGDTTNKIKNILQNNETETKHYHEHSKIHHRHPKIHHEHSKYNPYHTHSKHKNNVFDIKCLYWHSNIFMHVLCMFQYVRIGSTEMEYLIKKSADKDIIKYVRPTKNCNIIKFIELQEKIIGSCIYDKYTMELKRKKYHMVMLETDGNIYVPFGCKFIIPIELVYEIQEKLYDYEISNDFISVCPITYLNYKKNKFVEDFEMMNKVIDK